MEASALSADETRTRFRPLALLRDAVIRELPLLLVVIAYIGAAYILHATMGFPEDVGISLSSWRLLSAWTGAYAAMGFIAMLGYGLVRHGRSLRDSQTWKLSIEKFFEPRALIGFAVVYALLPPFMSAFVGFKMTIPVVHPFSWDARFMEWDRLLHLGIHPWQVLVPVFGTPAMTAFIDQVYYTWFPFIWLTLLWQLWHGDDFSQSRSQFLLSFALCWILLGTVAATLLSSAGPVYYANVAQGPDPYARLMARLTAVDAIRPLTALWAQEVLWQSYVDPGAVRVEGISAMPSMHVAMATLMTLVALKVNRWLGLAYAIYASLIFLGSVYLAWHYALDGYVAAVGTVLIWVASGRITERWARARRRPEGVP